MLLVIVIGVFSRKKLRRLKTCIMIFHAKKQKVSRHKKTGKGGRGQQQSHGNKNLNFFNVGRVKFYFFFIFYFWGAGKKF